MNNEKNIVSNQLTKQLKLNIADVIIKAQCADAGISLRTSDNSQRFLVSHGRPDCVINVHYGPLPEVALERQLFDSAGGPWRLYSSGEKLVFQVIAGSPDRPFVHRMAIFEPEFDRGEEYICPASMLPIANPIPLEKERLSLDPYIYPLDELLLSNLLAQGRGLHVHAFGVVYEGRGLVFCGVSGAGKSTLAELWKNRQVKILSDDRVALRWQNGRIWAHGTPWHGTARISLPEKAPLEALYFLKQAPENRIAPLSATEAATRLMSRCFPTFYLKAGMEYTLSFIGELTQAVPCYELQFTPDQRAVDEVLNHGESHVLSSR